MHLLVVRSLLLLVVWHLHGLEVRWGKVRHGIIGPVPLLIPDDMDNLGAHLVLRPHMLAAPLSIAAAGVATFNRLVDLLPLTVVMKLGVILKVR